MHLLKLIFSKTTTNYSCLVSASAQAAVQLYTAQDNNADGGSKKNGQAKEVPNEIKNLAQKSDQPKAKKCSFFFRSLFLTVLLQVN